MIATSHVHETKASKQLRNSNICTFLDAVYKSAANQIIVMYSFLMEVTKQAIYARFKQGSQRRSISKIFGEMIKIRQVLLNY